jgi:hypothetical protein
MQWNFLEIVRNRQAFEANLAALEMARLLIFA